MQGDARFIWDEGARFDVIVCWGGAEEVDGTDAEVGEGGVVDGVGCEFILWEWREAEFCGDGRVSGFMCGLCRICGRGRCCGGCDDCGVRSEGAFGGSGDGNNGFFVDYEGVVR